MFFWQPQNQIKKKSKECSEAYKEKTILISSHQTRILRDEKWSKPLLHASFVEKYPYKSAVVPTVGVKKQFAEIARKKINSAMAKIAEFKSKQTAY
jgi:hypothetical protein